MTSNTSRASEKREIIMIPNSGGGGWPTHFLKAHMFSASALSRVIFTRMKELICEAWKELCNYQLGILRETVYCEQFTVFIWQINMTFDEILLWVFLDVMQSFDRVWHEGLLNTIKRDFLPNYNVLSFTKTLSRQARGRDVRLKSVCAGVAQCSVLGPTLYVSEIPSYGHTVATYVDDTAVMVISASPGVAWVLQGVALKIEERN